MFILIISLYPETALQAQSIINIIILKEEKKDVIKFLCTIYENYFSHKTQLLIKPRKIAFNYSLIFSRI